MRAKPGIKSSARIPRDGIPQRLFYLDDIAVCVENPGVLASHFFLPPFCVTHGRCRWLVGLSMTAPPPPLLPASPFALFLLLHSATVQAATPCQSANNLASLCGVGITFYQFIDYTALYGNGGTLCYRSVLPSPAHAHASSVPHASRHRWVHRWTRLCAISLTALRVCGHDNTIDRLVRSHVWALAGWSHARRCWRYRTRAARVAVAMVPRATWRLHGPAAVTTTRRTWGPVHGWWPTCQSLIVAAR